MDRFLSGLGIINAFCETDSLVFLAIAAVVLGLILSLLVAIVLWPLDGRVRIENDPMHHPFGDMPVLPRQRFQGGGWQAPSGPAPTNLPSGGSGVRRP